jgi:hypothetical protein
MPVAGAAIAAGGSLIAGRRNARAAENAADAGAQGSRDAIAAQMAFYNQNRQDNYGGMVTGNSALRRIAEMYGLDYSTAQPSWNGVSMSGGEATSDSPSTMQRMLDPGGLIWQGSSSTTPLQFQTGGGGDTNPGTPDPLQPNQPLPTNQNNPPPFMPGGNPIATGSGTADFSSFYRTPDYLVREREGIQALDRGAAARGRLYSGGADADRMRFGADLGAQGFGSYLGTLMNLAGYGGNATQAVGSAGGQAAAGIGNASQNMGAARASGYLNAAQARNDGWNGFGTALGSLWGNQGWGG